mgnify:CR=1 FL=1
MIIRTDNLVKTYGERNVVNGVSIEVEQGTIVGLLGPNGAGKTTFFNVCSGIYKPTKGKVYLCGEDISNMHPEAISLKGIARTFQTTQLFKYMSVLDNVKIGRHSRTKTNLFDAIFHTKRYKEAEAYAIQKSLETIEKAGLSEYTHVKAGNLSYGIQRRVEIARALATDPKILLLDEPAAGMNPLETLELREFVKELNAKGQTILLIEHDMKFVMNCCHNILVLNFGQKICEGTPEVVQNDKKVQEAYFGSGMLTKEAIENA